MTTKRLAILLIVNAVLLSFFIGAHHATFLRTVKTVDLGPFNFDSRSSRPELSQVKEYFENHAAAMKAVTIHFRMTVHAISNWNNVFQTAPLNDGMRLELSAPATLCLLVGHSTARKIGDERTYPLLSDLQLHHEYSIDIQSDQNGFLNVAIDGAPKIRADMNTLDGRLANFDISDIAIGTGFSKARPFDGALQDFRIHYQLLDKSQAAHWIKNGIECVLLFTLTVLLGILLYRGASYGIRSFKGARLRPLTRENKIRCLSLVLTIGFIASTFFQYFQAMFWGKAYPKNTYLPAPVTRYGDLYAVLDQWKHFHFSGVGYGLSYFPSTYLLIAPFAKFPPYGALIVFLTLFTLFTVIYVYLNIRTDDRLESLQNTLICALTSYPFLFTYHTANVEMFVFMFLCLFIHFYREKRWMLSTWCLAMPLSMKAFPGVFLVLYFSDRKYREIALTLLWTAVLSLVPLLIFDGGIRSGFGAYLSRLKASQDMYKQLMIISTAGLHYGHSALGAIRILTAPYFPAMKSVMLPYLLFAATVFLALVFYLVRVETEFWKKVALLVIAMNVLPYTSTDYKLMHLFIPLFLFIDQSKGDKFDIPYILLFSLLLIPKNYAYFYHWPLYSLNNVLNPLFMVAIAVLIIGSRSKAIQKELGVVSYVPVRNSNLRSLEEVTK